MEHLFKIGQAVTPIEVMKCHPLVPVPKMGEIYHVEGHYLRPYLGNLVVYIKLEEISNAIYYEKSFAPVIDDDVLEKELMEINLVTV